MAEDLTEKVSVLTRLVLTMLAALLGAWLLGAVLERIDLPGLDSLLLWSPLAIAFTVFAVGGVANSINIIDGYNGLAGGYAVMVLAALAWVAKGVATQQAGIHAYGLPCFGRRVEKSGGAPLRNDHRFTPATPPIFRDEDPRKANPRAASRAGSGAGRRGKNRNEEGAPEGGRARKSGRSGEWEIGRDAKRLLLAFVAQLRRCHGRRLVFMFATVLGAIASLCIPDRPGRVEPRAKKRRPKPLPLLTMPRHLAREKIIAERTARGLIVAT